MQVKPDPARIAADLETLATFRDPGLPGWTRRAFSPAYYRSREWLADCMTGAGLEVSIDGGANLIGRLSGSDPRSPAILVGSHTDTVIGGGRFDGIAGVLAGIELARCLRESRIQLRHALEVVDFLAEEPTDFGISTVGSRAMVGSLEPAMLSLADHTGRTLGAALGEAGGAPGNLASALRRPAEVALFLELHIEQGPVLEKEGLRIGLVNGLVGMRRLRAVFEGRPDHAGTTPMGIRRDALAAAAEAVLALESVCRDEKSVGTVGRMSVEPGATNVVPGRVELTAEMRSQFSDVLASRWTEFQSRLRNAAESRRVAASVELLSAGEPVIVSEEVLALLEESCRSLGLPVRKLPSGAGHDANQLAKIAPIGMVFIPCKDGRSHCPEEWASADDIALGLQVVAGAILRFDEKHSPGKKGKI